VCCPSPPASRKKSRTKPSYLIESSLFNFTNAMRIKTILTSLSILAGGATIANAATIIGDGDASPFATGGNADGWSGITVLESAVISSATEGGGQLQATGVTMLAGAGRAGGTHHFMPLLVNSANEIAWIGPQLTPSVDGLNTFAITGADPIDATGGDLRLGVWQWNDGVNNSNGGTIAFAGSGGGGMFQQDINGTLGAAGVAVGNVVASGHASGAGGRDYHIDLTVAPLETADSDGDGLPDSWETANNLDPGDPADASGDPDNDNLTNTEEFELRTDPNNDDSDEDGVNDGAETGTGDFVDANDTGTDPLNPDTDGDGLADGVENPDLAHNPLNPSQQPGTDPNLADTDGDGKNDSEELADGTDPTDENDILVPTGVIVGDGAERPFDTGGSPDGWSGITVLETAIIDSSTLPGAGDLVEILEVSMLAAAGRAGGTHHLIPLLVNSANEIAWIGPELTPTQPGHNVFPITGADQIDVSTETYRLGIWQWNEGVNNSAGGTIAFAGSGGGGMFQQDIDGTLGAAGVSIGHVVTTGHSSGAGGRDYQIDVLVGTSEPDVVILTDVSSDSGAGTISFSWESKAGKLYNLRSEADPALIAAVEPLDWPISDGNFDIAATPPENTLTIPMPADLTRLFVIEGFPAPPVSIFSDDFEGGQGGWTTGTEGAVGTMWELGLPGFGPEAANSPTSCFGTNLTALYAEDADVWLRSPPIDLTNTGGATLNYFEWRDIETAFDSGRVVVLDATDNSEIAEIENPIDGFSNGWENVSQQIPPAALGREIKIEFRFQSDDIANFPGWYIDDVLVTIP
jgi:hypothetical protein